jgi:tRNA(Arg) A34 adenosine deaminase TadA
MDTLAAPAGAPVGTQVTLTDEVHLLQAVAVGRAGMLAYRGGPFGALITGPDGEVLAEGCNQVTSTNDPTAHAEMVAIRAACDARGDCSLAGCTLYSSCEPCPMCLAAAYWARLDRVVHGATRDDAARGGFDDAFLYEELALPPSERRLRVRHVPMPEASGLFDEWLALEARTPY